MSGMLSIGPVEIGVPFVQAALSGYSDLPMRRVARMHGAVYALNEVVLDQTVLTHGKKQRLITRVAADDHPVGGQLMGARADEFARAAGLMVEAGYDVIDINFACPVRKVLGRCRGGFLLSQPREALEIVRAVYEAVAGRRPVTVKMRRGMDDSPESDRRFWEILDGSFEIGVAGVTVHGRTVAQRYVGSSCWPFLERVKRRAGQKVVLGSGDLFAPGDCLRMMRETGVDGVAIARGCIGNPWIFHECNELLAGRELPPPPGVPEQGRTIRRHFEWSEETHGPRLAGRIMRKFGIKYSELHPEGLKVRDAFIRVKDRDDWLSVLDEWYDPSKTWPPGVRKTGPGDLIAAGAMLGEGEK
jgi:tRNA-dihydrouridine synthase B